MAGFVVQFAKCGIRTFACSTKTANVLSAPSAHFLQSVSRTVSTSHHLRADRLYTNQHEWISVDGKIGTVGISDYAQDALGDVVYAQLPDVGSTINKGDECGALESVKAASELMSPVSGKVTEKNDAVETKPGLINSACYDAGWLFKVELSKPEELKQLMNEGDYNTYLKSDPH